MYKRVTVEDTVRIPPEHLGDDLQSSVEDGLRSTLAGRIEPDVGVFVAVEEVNTVEGGEIRPEDAGVHYDVEFQAIVFEPELHEVVQGETVDLTSFGAFIRIGPFDGLCHVSQVMDEYVDFDEEATMLKAEESGHSLATGDTVTTRIIAVSLDKQDTNKINLTMRQPGLGKQTWVEEAEEERREEEEEAEA